MDSRDDRRTRRSEDPITALHYQLAYARHHAGLEAMVLVDASGALVAGAGAWPVCEELAAFAPLLVRQGEARPEVRAALTVLRENVALRSMEVDGCEVLLASKGPQGVEADASMVRAARGCLRILGVAALPVTTPPAFRGACNFRGNSVP
jgi:hypothetical protein